MTNPDEYHFHPDLSLDAEVAGIEAADLAANAISRSLAESTGRELTTDERAMVQDIAAPGFAHFYSLGEQAGDLAGQGDIVGAFSLMGGVENARELLGDTIVDGLLAELDSDFGNIQPNDFE